MNGPASPDSSDADASAELEPAQELAELARLVRSALEWQRMTGALGLPHGELPNELPAASSAVETGSPSPRPDVRVEARREPAVNRPPVPAPVVAVARAEAAEPIDAAERTQRLTVLENTVRTCTACALHLGRTQTVFARGTGSSGLCFIGEGPGADEDAQGYPFVGPAGQLLDRMIAAMGLGRDDVYVCNTVKCRPPKNRKPEPDEMAACSPYLAEQLTLVAPKVIVALGATAVQGLLGTTEGITRMRGTWKLYQGRIPVMPTFHPAYLLRTPAAKREVWADLQAVLQQMGRALPVRTKG